MSGRAGVRSSSRRNTPQSPPQTLIGAVSEVPQRSTRTTRSQSRDVSDGEAGIQSTRRSAGGKQVESSRGRGGRKTKQAIRLGPQHDLSAVAEEPDDAGIEQEEDQDAVEARRSSAISGTTARTSHSAQELVDLRADDMLYALPDLADASDKVLDLVLPHSIAELSQDRVEAHLRTLQDPSSAARKRLNRLMIGYREQKGVYGNELYINLSIALRGMLGVRRPVEVGDGPWRPDNVFYKANLANLVTELLSLRADVKQPFVEKMDRDFPTPFLSQISSKRQASNPTGVTFLVNETFEAAFSLRVQSFLSTMKQYIHELNFDPDDVLRQTFYDDNGALRGWDIKGLRTGELSKQQQIRMVKRLESIRTHFSQESGNQSAKEVVDVRALKSKYPWSECVVKLVVWARLRANEIETHLASVGGADNLQSAFEAELQSRKGMLAKSSEEAGGVAELVLDYVLPEASNRPSHQVELTKEVPTSTTGKAAKVSPEYGTPAAVMTMKQKFATARLAKQRDGLPQPPLNDNRASTIVDSSAQFITQVTRSDEFQVPATPPAKVLGVFAVAGAEEGNQLVLNNDEPRSRSSSDDSPVERSRKILEIYQRSLDEENKENRPQSDLTSTVPQKKRAFIDPQPNAQKVPFESQVATQQRPGTSQTKRSRSDDAYQTDEDQQSEVSEDGDFQTQVLDLPHEPKVSRPTGNKRPSSAAPPRSPRKRARLTQESERSATLDPDLQAAVDMANGQPAPSQIEIYKVANKESKMATARHVRKTVQRRTPWTDLETETLQELITTHGISWAKLKDMDKYNGNVLIDRDQVALRDKARNMKIDYLKAGVALPNNFGDIALKEADKIKLRDNHGIDLFAVEEESGEDDD